jgi:O-Antigen ligase
MASLALNFKKPEANKSNALAYGALVAFSFLYFARPEDLVHALSFIPIEKILGGVALLALLFGIRGRASFAKWPREMKLLAAMLAWQIIDIPFAWYIGGALATVTEKCSKALIVALLVGLVVDTIPQLRRLIFIQAASVAAMTLFSVLIYKGGRMGGVLGGVFDNPNDLAMNIALNFPLCLMFLLLEKNPLKKFLWFGGLIVMGRGLMLTYSRSGFLALGVAILFSLWEFGIRNKRYYLLVGAAFCVLGLAVVGPQSYGDRIESIFSNDVEVYGDAKQARFEILMVSLETTAKRPIFGVGPGNFPSYTDTWHVTHNTYTELSSECGIPVLILFLLVIRECFRNLIKIRKTAVYAADPDVRMFTSALWSGFASYLVGAAFASTAYQLFPYFMVGYTTALLRLCSESSVSAPQEAKPVRRSWLTGPPQPVPVGGTVEVVPVGLRRNF